MYERAEARVDLEALAHNCRQLKSRLAPNVELCPVLKADGYGHGALHCITTVRDAGADRIAVATAREAVQVRSILPEMPLLVLGALAPGEIEMVVSARTDVAAWDPAFIVSLATQAAAIEGQIGVHVKYDTGMGRLGSSDPEEVLEMARSVAANPNLRLEAIWTHFATSDDPDPTFRNLQRDRLAALGERVRAEFPWIRLHGANSAAMIADPGTHFDLVRPGCAIYGMDPFGNDPVDHGLRPVLSFHSYVASIKNFEPGMSAGYGRTWTASEPTQVAVVPVGYGDGVRRSLSNRGQVLIGGQRYPIVGTVSMDNITIELGSGRDIQIGDEVTLIGSQDGSSIRAEEIADWMGTINYEVTCGLSPRVPRIGVNEPV